MVCHGAIPGLFAVRRCICHERERQEWARHCTGYQKRLPVKFEVYCLKRGLPCKEAGPAELESQLMDAAERLGMMFAVVMAAGLGASASMENVETWGAMGAGPGVFAGPQTAILHSGAPAAATPTQLRCHLYRQTAKAGPIR